MTNEDAIKVLKMIEAHGSLAIQAKEKAIQALEAQPTHGSTYGGVSWGETYKEEAQPNSNEFFNFDAPMVKKSDAVSREAVIRLVEQYPNIIGNRCSGLIADIKHLPSVTPQIEPSEDCISREEVQDLISRWLSDYLLDETREALETINYKVGDMPSVTPSYNSIKTELKPCEDCISRKSVRQKLQENYDFFVNAYGGFGNLPQSDKPRVDEIDNCIAIVVDEPPVIPQMKKGRWIDVLDEKTEYSETHHFECSICGCGSHWTHELEKFCPNCGAEMSGGGEDV